MACFIIALEVKRGSIALIKNQSSVAEDEHDGLPKLTVCTCQKNIATLHLIFESHIFLLDGLFKVTTKCLNTCSLQYLSF